MQAHTRFSRLQMLIVRERDRLESLPHCLNQTVHFRKLRIPAECEWGQGRLHVVDGIPEPERLDNGFLGAPDVGFSDGLRSELRRENILVTTVCPGLMRTGSPPNAT